MAGWLLPAVDQAAGSDVTVSIAIGDVYDGDYGDDYAGGQLLPAITQAVVSHVDLSTGWILPEITQAAGVQVGGDPVDAAIGQVLPRIGQDLEAVSNIEVVIVQTLPELGQSATVGASVAVQIGQALPEIGQSATVAVVMMSSPSSSPKPSLNSPRTSTFIFQDRARCRSLRRYGAGFTVPVTGWSMSRIGKVNLQ